MEKEKELTLKERAILMGILVPLEGSKLQQILIKSMIDRLKFTDLEEKKYDIKSEGKRIFWKPEASKETFKVPFSDVEISILKEISSKMDKAEKVTQENLPLILKIDSWQDQ